MNREEFLLSLRNMDLQEKKKRIDSKMVCFGNSLLDIRRAISTMEIQYHNNDKQLSDAIQALRDAYENLESAYKNAQRNYNTIDDVVAYMKPQYVSVDNGQQIGTEPIHDFEIEADVDGVHMYIRR